MYFICSGYATGCAVPPPPSQQVADATEDRKQEHEENVETLANDNAAKGIIEAAFPFSFEALLHAK